MMGVMEKDPIAVLDGNNFFVSCERLFRPDLIGQPVLVLSSNDGCVVARSQEVKDIGIPMGVPYFQIKDIIKDNTVTVFSSNFPLYRDLSRRLFSLVRQEVSLFEQYSIDEGFFTLPLLSAQETALRLREKIMRTLGLPVSIGVAPSKTLAKLAVQRAKKRTGVEVWDVAQWTALAPTVALGELWGVGARRALAFRSVGLLTAEDVRRAPVGYLRSRFGVEGERLYAELCGEVAYPISGRPQLQKSLMHSRSFGQAVTQKTSVMEAVFYHAQQAATDLARMGAGAQKMTVFIGSGRGGGVMRRQEVSFGEPVADPLVLLSYAKQAVDNLYEEGVVYKRAGVTLSELVPGGSYPASMFGESEEESKRRDVGDVMHSIKARWGSSAISIGLTQKRSVWQPKRASVSPAYTTHWEQLCRVRARY